MIAILWGPLPNDRHAQVPTIRKVPTGRWIKKKKYERKKDFLFLSVGPVFDILMNLCRQFAKWYVTFLTKMRDEKKIERKG